MRLLSSSDADAILASVRSTISSFPFLFDPNNARIISGTEEATFDWLSVQQIQLLFGAESGAEYYGVVDEGGASVQIAFNYDNFEGRYDPSTFLNVQFNNSVVSIYGYSHLYYGHNEAFKLVKNKIVAAQGIFSSISFPFPSPSFPPPFPPPFSPSLPPLPSFPPSPPPSFPPPFPLPSSPSLPPFLPFPPPSPSSPPSYSLPLLSLSLPFPPPSPPSPLSSPPPSSPPFLFPSPSFLPSSPSLFPFPPSPLLLPLPFPLLYSSA